MPLIRVGQGVTDIKGSIAGSTFSRNPAGIVSRSRTRGVNPRSTHQARVRTGLAQLNERWHTTLTAAQRQGWENYAKPILLPNKLGETKPRTGKQHYLRSNLPRIAAQLPPTDTPPTATGLPAHDPRLTLAVTPVGIARDNPVFARHLLYEGACFLYLHQGGPYWFRWRLNRINNVTGSYGDATIYALWDASYGIIRPGKIQDYDRRHAQSASWYNAAANGWKLRYGTSAGRWIEWKIPDAHNRYHVTVRTNTTYGKFNLTLGTTSGGTDLNAELDKTVIDLAADGPPNDITELVIATQANSPGEKYLRLTADSATIVYFSGIHTFDTDGLATPEQLLASDSLWLGNDFADLHQGWLPTFTLTDNLNAYPFVKPTSVETTIRWKPQTETTYKWSSTGPAHYGPGNANLMSSIASGLYVGGTLIAALTDTVTIPPGKLHQHANLEIKLVAKGDYNEDGDITDPEDCMGLSLVLQATPAGFNISSTISWSADADCTHYYTPRIAGIDASEGTAIINNVSYRYKGDAISDYAVPHATAVALYPDNLFSLVTMSVDYVTQTIFEDGTGTTTNHYCRVDLSQLTGGQHPPLGTNWPALITHITHDHYPNAAAVTFDRFLDWPNESDAHLYLHSGRPVRNTRRTYTGPWRFAGLLTGHASTPPPSPSDIIIPYNTATSQTIFFRVQLARADGRITNPIQQEALQ